MMKNIPIATPETRTYWQGCREHKLRLQYCSSCARYQFYPRLVCTICTSSKLEWREASGVGEIGSFTIVRRAISDAYAAEVPYIVALVKLAEGPQMMSNIVDYEPKDAHIGMTVTVCFDDSDDAVTIPKFRPIMDR